MTSLKALLFGNENKITRRLIVLTIAFSSVITLLISTVELVFEYRELRSGMDRTLDRVDIFVPSLSDSVWNFDDAQIRLTLDALKQLPNVDRVVVSTPDLDKRWTTGKDLSPHVETRTYKLRRSFRGVNTEIGMLEVAASLDAIYRQVVAHAFWIVLSNGLKTMLVALFMVSLLRVLVTSRLEQLALKVSAIGPKLFSRESARNEPWPTPAGLDELDAVDWAIEKTTNELKLAQTALLESRSLLFNVIDSAMDAIITCDETGRILVFNHAAEVLFGCAAADAIGGPLDRFIPERFRAAHTGQIRAFSRSGISRRKMGNPGTVTGLRADGAVIALEATIARTEAEGKPLLTVMLRDVAARIAAAEAQRDALVREVHHRIKNNLQGVIGLVREHVDAHPELKDLTDIMLGQIRAIAIIHGMLGERASAAVSLCGIVREMSLAVMGAAGAKIAVELDGRDSVFLAEDEAVPIALVMNEMLYNAVKHARGRDEGDLARVAMSAGHGAVRVVISNSGALSADFDFEKGIGIGTGLNLVKALLPRRGASVKFAEEAGQVYATISLTAPAILLT